MKKIILITSCLALFLSACNKNKKFNKSIDGTWITTSINGVPVTMADDPVQYKFSKSGKDGGTIKITYFDNGAVDDEYTGSYKISDDGKTITIDATESLNSGNSSGPDSKIHLVDRISNQEKTKYTATENYAETPSGFTGVDIFVFEKK